MKIVLLFIFISVFTSCEREFKKGDNVYVEVKTNTLGSWISILHKELKCASRIKKICIVGESDFSGYEKCTKCMSENDVLIVEASKNEKQEERASESDENDNLKNLYSTLKNEGYTPPEYEEFKKDMGFNGVQKSKNK